MSIEIKVPELPESVADAVIANWYKQVGESINEDEVLVDLETDKVILEVPTIKPGVVKEILFSIGDTVTAGQLLAVIDVSQNVAAQDHKQASESPAEDKSRVEDNMDKKHNGAAAMSPSVRKMMAEKNIDATQLTGTGKQGRILKQDVEKYLTARAVEKDSLNASTEESALVMAHGSAVMSMDGRYFAKSQEGGAVMSRKDGISQGAMDGGAVMSRKDGISQGAMDGGAINEPKDRKDEVIAAKQSVSKQNVSGERLERRVPMTRLRARIAERLVQSQHEAAILTTFNEVNMKPVIELRSRYKQAFEKKFGVRLGFMSFFVRASVEALKQFPEINASIDANDIVYHGFYDIGVAVSGPNGLVVPILRDADIQSIAEIEQSIINYAEKAMENSLAIEDITGGTFTISNGGVFGSMLSTPIINPPQSAILGMHNITERAMVVDGEIIVLPMMYLALSYDHRLVDGKSAVQFLVTIKQLLEDPSRMLLGV